MNILWAILSCIFFNYYLLNEPYYFAHTLKIYNFQKDKIIEQKGVNWGGIPLYGKGKYFCTQNNIKDNKLRKKNQEKKKKIFQFIYTHFKSNKKDGNVFKNNMLPLLNYYNKSTNATNQWCCRKPIYNDGNKIYMSSESGKYINVHNPNTTENFDIKEIKKYEQNINKKNIHAIFLCGGVGKRTELTSRKQFLHLDNIPLFIYSFNLFIKCNYIKSISLVCDSNFFSQVVENINVYNSLLLKKKIQNNFLKVASDNILEKENNLKEISENNEQNKTAILNYLKENKYIIYDNEKNKCIFDMEELLNDLKGKKKNNKIYKIKPKDIDTNRYKLITIVGSGAERIDSFLNALKPLDIYENNQEYIYKALENYLKKNYHLNSKFNIEFDYDYLCKGKSDENIIKKKKEYITDILVHDGARPFLSELDFFNLIYQSSLGKNVILGTKATDTIKLLNSNEQRKDGYNSIKKTIDRKVIFQAQTPQIFESKTLLKILPYLISPSKSTTTNSNTSSDKNRRLQNRPQFTDTSSVVQHFTKNKIITLQATFPNFKITTPSDVFQSVFFMKYIYNSNASNDAYRNLFKEEYINSDSNYILTNQFNNFFFFDSLNKKQKMLYQRFYYKHTYNSILASDNDLKNK
ncbi:2-C-methyl-D-erythritol 4-phosphate cytidylyltransferase, putative [Plasmodium chabaudi chabaudi]|uniref:2-C-methyl-D-erythritol 4-phosphate cytidylyltransferase, putative n=1 Tax=Plasmodium chabaudi chabaudi TaxID=31271 RepID=A0A4V0K3E4_PLACU|nr:2-C-methyl-D-erythritol 4-phosphate cytidylyltransferase, putative [Plasmodium chabaudi chabaudi]VTZ66826.1 2-C-methyl-D-erythritol 4-phosphate cytidylyltransferase, putative [Plasmodium chabaudi chabaudi]|eukprot:XP_742791.2 2-C-methyl-D-erythritol 4-phosphate cytidylyltransferase, putative [Plasmodium chabaudi chabaudi]